MPTPSRLQASSPLLVLLLLAGCGSSTIGSGAPGTGGGGAPGGTAGSGPTGPGRDGGAGATAGRSGAAGQDGSGGRGVPDAGAAGSGGPARPDAGAAGERGGGEGGAGSGPGGAGSGQGGDGGGAGGAGSGAAGEGGEGGRGEGGAGSGAGGQGDGLVYRRANLTNYTSYPDPNSEECIEYNGCQWAGQFAFVDGQQPESWVMSHNIAAVHERDADTYRLKTLRLRQGDRQLDVVVYDMCSDSDCDGCCTRNAGETGFLIDIEKYTMERFGSGDGIVEFACLDCN